VSLAELQEQLDLPRKIQLSRELWVAAAVLGLLRTVVNDEYRQATRDRGTAKNILNDLQGSLGELVGIRLLDQAGFNASAQGLLDLNGSVDRPDLVADTDPPTLLDVKCHFDEHPKRLFLINEKARLRSINRGVVAFLPIVTAALRQGAYLGKLIPIEQLQGWKRQVVGRYGDPSRQIPLTTLDQHFLGAPSIRWGTAQPDKQWGPRVLPLDSIERLQHVVGRSMLLRLRHTGFSLDGLTYSEARLALLDLLPPDLRTKLIGDG
jgi:hypothetical protein